MEVESISDETPGLLKVKLATWQWREGERSRSILLRAMKGDSVLQEISVTITNPFGLSVRPTTAIGRKISDELSRCRFYLSGDRSLIDSLVGPGNIELLTQPEGCSTGVNVSSIKRLSETACIMEVEVGKHVFAKCGNSLKVLVRSSDARRMFGSVTIVNDGS